jgi:hypothetical protein
MNGVVQTGWCTARFEMHQDAAGGIGRRAALAVMKALWHLTFEPVYRRLFRRHFEAIAGRLEEVAAELHVYDSSLRNQSAAISDYGTELRTHVHGLNVRLDSIAARVAALDEQVRTVIAGQWEQEAITRRLASIEDRMPAGGHDAARGAP